MVDIGISVKYGFGSAIESPFQRLPHFRLFVLDYFPAPLAGPNIAPGTVQAEKNNCGVQRAAIA